ncbi:MAG: RagB/SusD family nutrient uptake outer membrane protein [Chitinophagaceae bacterium]
MQFKNICIGLTLSALMVLPSCKKVIDIEPEFQKDGSKIFTTVADYEFALTGAYSLFRQTGYFGSGGQTTSTWANLPDMMTDNLVQTGEDLANWQNQTNWLYTTAENDIDVAWTAAYSVIAQANLVLRNIDQFSATGAKQINRIKGQALAIRAIAHFDVLRYWGVDFDRNSTALGIPYITQVDIELKPKRLTVKESWDNILKDMLEAETRLADVDKSINTASNKTNIDQIAVRALLARMYLYAKDYVKAEQYASLAIAAVPLASRAAFPNIWRDASQAEVLWSVSFSPGEGSPSSGAHNAPSNRNRFRPSASLINLYDNVNDVRFPAYLASRQSGSAASRPILPFGDNTRKIMNKFVTRGTTLDNVVNWKVVRTGEMYLIRAEARALQGGSQEALGLKDLNDLRAARITGYVPLVSTGAALQNEIQVERRRELFGEGHRWFDLKRTTRTIMRADVTLASTKITLAATAREWVWPIPQAEIDANPNMQGQQNPGW